MYKISILLPVYNVGEYLDSCLSSLKNQTIGFENLEIIFVDDCSTDNSYKIIKSYSEQYENVKAYQTPTNSGGGGQPRNIALDNATAPYIMYLDPDDTYFENACEILYINAINTDADMVSGNYVEYKNHQKIKPMDYKKSFGLKGNYLEIKNIKEFPRLLAMSPALWVKIYKRSFLVNNNFQFIEYSVAEDLLFVVQCLLKANGIVYIDYPIVKYRIRENENKSKSVTAIRNVKNVIDHINIYNKVHDTIKDYDEELAWMASVHLYFWTRHIILSNASKVDKMDYLYNSKELYVDFTEHYKPLSGFEIICDLISKKNYTKTIQMAELMKNDLTNDEEFLEELKEHKIIVLSKDNNLQSLQNYTTISLINTLSSHFSIEIINLDEIPLFNEIKSHLVSKLSKHVTITNIYQYFENENYSISIHEENNNIRLTDARNNCLTFETFEELTRFFIIIYSLTEDKKPIIINESMKTLNIYEGLSSDITINIPYVNVYDESIIKTTELNNVNSIVTDTSDTKSKLTKHYKNHQIYQIPQIIDLKTKRKNNKNTITILANQLEDLDIIKNILNTQEKTSSNINLNIYTYKKSSKKLSYEYTDNFSLNIKSIDTLNELQENLDKTKTIINISNKEKFLPIICLAFKSKIPIITLDTTIINKAVLNEDTCILLKDTDNFINLDKILSKQSTQIKVENAHELYQKYFSKDIIYHKWLEVIKNEYVNTQKEIINHENYFETLFKKVKNQRKKIKGQNQVLIGQNRQINKDEKELKKLKKQFKTDDKTIKNQKKIINKQNNTIKTKDKKIKQLTTNQKNIIKQKNNINKNYKKFVQKDKDKVGHLRTTEDYYKLKGNFKKKLLLFLPYLYIIFRHNNVLENIKLYRLLQNNDWFDIGFYLDKYSDISRNKWCKFLTPELHYVCHGFDEKRLPYPNYKNNLSKNGIIKRINNK